MQAKINYQFNAKIWKDTQPGGWYFVSLPEAMSKEIREHLQWQEEGWGRMKATVHIESVTWDTAIWYDTKMKTYLLPLKAVIRKKAKLSVDQTVAIQIAL